MKTNNLKKQEEKKCCVSCGEYVAGVLVCMWTECDCHTPKIATKQEEKPKANCCYYNEDCPKCPKVATSEKEGIPLHCKHCGKVTSECEEFKKAFDPTPHESEDWVEFNLRARAGIQLQLEQAMKSGRTNKKLDFEEIRKRTDIAFESIKELAQSTSSKAYQRGREELREKAVQEIEKGKRKITICSEEDYKNGTSCNNCESGLSECTNASKDKEHNDGLDKVKSIISGVMKK